MNKVLILDFGSQYTQLIGRRVRELRVYCEIHPCTLSFDHIKSFGADAIILSGGPASVLGKGSPKIDSRVFELGLPVLGICYGLQLMAYLLGGKVIPASKREYGKSLLKLNINDILFKDISKQSTVWMSHGDSVEKLPLNFKLLGETENSIPSVIAHNSKKIYGLQFHPEVVHTEFGTQFLKNFLFEVAGLKADWTMESFEKKAIEEIRKKVGPHKVILGLSGGVDSSVAAFLIHKAIGDQLHCIFVDNGLLRKNEVEEVKELFAGKEHINLKVVNGSKVFLDALKKVTDPEKKRKTIGRIFVELFEKEAKKIKGAKFLGQGTLYPDVIESVSHKGPSAVIKSHHNVGGLPKKMGLELLEPFRELFKDEVRDLGRQMNVPKNIIERHPFPGPGLAIRIIGEITKERLSVLKEADSIVTSEIKSAGLYQKTWQAFAVLLPIKTVGVMGDERTYENVCAVRIVESTDGMTADWADMPHDVMAKISNRIINEVRGINRVVYDISSKPPATIEWE